MLMTYRSIVLATLLIGPGTTSDFNARPAPAGTTLAPSLFSTATQTAPAAPDGCWAHRWQGYFGGWYANVGWNDNSDNEDGFNVEWSGPHQQHGTITVPSNSTQVYNLPSGTNFKYRVQAFNAYGDSAWSNWAHATTGGNG